MNPLTNIVVTKTLVSFTMEENNSDYSLPKSLNIRLIGFDEELANRVGNSVLKFLLTLSEQLPLCNLDGVTIAYDYFEELQRLDRGYTSLPPLVPTADEQLGTGVAMAIPVKRDGTPKTHLMFGPAIVQLLADHTNEDAFQTGVELLIHEVGHAVDHEWKYRAFGDYLFKPTSDFIDNSLDEYLWKLGSLIWDEYCANRIASSILRKGDLDRELFQSTRDTVFSRIHNARVLYHVGVTSLDEFLGVVASNLDIAFKATGCFLGLRDGEIDCERLTHSTEEIFKDHRSKLLLTFHPYLLEIWEKRGDWGSFEDFIILNKATLNLLHELKLYPSISENGGLYMDVPINLSLIS